MQNDKLLNCPFCNCGAIYEITESEDIVEKVPALFCNGCKMIFKIENDSPYLNDDMTFDYLKEKLHKQFNTRKPMERIVEQLEKEKEKANVRAMTENSINGHSLDFESFYGQRMAYCQAIEIVKGGVDNAG